MEWHKGSNRYRTGTWWLELRFGVRHGTVLLQHRSMSLKGAFFERTRGWRERFRILGIEFLYSKLRKPRLATANRV